MGKLFSKKRRSTKVEIKYHASAKKAPKVLKRSQDDEPNILIIGAGAAGLSCAVELLNYGFKSVRVLEASNKIGGRIQTIKLGKSNVDLGAQWVQGQEQNIIYDMVYNLNLLDSSNELYSNMNWIRSNGEVLQKSVVKKLMKVISRIINERHQDLHLYDGPFSNYLMEKFLLELDNEELRNLNPVEAIQFVECFRKMECSMTTDGTDELSCKGFDLFQECRGDGLLNWKDKGFSRFLKVLLNADSQNELGILKDYIEFNRRVILIEWDNVDGTVVVACENQKSYRVDHVIITMGLGVLKKNLSSIFRPQLPADKRRSLIYTGVGHMCKIFIEFDIPFWDAEWNGFTAIWLEKDVNQIRKTKLAWVPDVYGFYRVEHQPHLLQAWAVGQFIEIIETTGMDDLLIGLMHMLRKFLPDKSIYNPKRAVTSKWSTDQNHLGAFSYPSMLSQRYNTSPELIAEPINVMAYVPTATDSFESIEPMTVRPVLLFAGEATSPHHFATVHGAVETGIREAARLAGYYWKDLT